MNTITDTNILTTHAKLAGDRANHVTPKEIILQVRIALAFLDNQTDPKAPKYSAEKHSIERWAGRYISEIAVRTAGKLLGLKGGYPDYTGIRFPHPNALNHIPEAYTHTNYCKSLASREWHKRADANHPNVLAVIARVAGADQAQAQRDAIMAVTK